MSEKNYSFTIVIHPAEEGGYWVSVPALPGCFTQGETIEEAIEMAKEAIQCHLEGLAIAGEPLPDPTKDDSGAVFKKVDVSVELA